MPTRSASSSFSRENRSAASCAPAALAAMAAWPASGFCVASTIPRKDAGEGGERGELAAFDELRQMPLRDVSDLVREHGRELALGLRDDDQTRIHRDDPAGPGKRVDGRRIDHEESIAPARVRARDALPERVDVVDHLGIIDHSKPPTNLRQERLAELVLFGRAREVSPAASPRSGSALSAEAGGPTANVASRARIVRTSLTVAFDPAAEVMGGTLAGETEDMACLEPENRAILPASPL